MDARKLLRFLKNGINYKDACDREVLRMGSGAD